MDTEIQGVYPLDRNRLTREWFYSGHAIYDVTGPKADEFAGQLVLGYQIGFPWSLGVGINFSYTTPNFMLDGGNFTPTADFNPLAYVITPNLFPGASISADLGNGGVFPLDRNRLTREWSHSGRARYRVIGAGSDTFAAS